MKINAQVKNRPDVPCKGVRVPSTENTIRHEYRASDRVHGVRFQRHLPHVAAGLDQRLEAASRDFENLEYDQQKGGEKR